VRARLLDIPALSAHILCIVSGEPHDDG
jgi:hypothetical protein